MLLVRMRLLSFTVWACMLAGGLLVAKDQPAAGNEPNLTEDQIKEFLLNAKVIDSHHTSKGVTAPWRLTLSDGTLTHDGSYQAIDERKDTITLASGRTEFNFRDSYHFNIAAYEIAKLLGLGDMMPVTVERKWKGDRGSLSWWLPVMMDEIERRKQNAQPPDAEAWNKQMYRKRVFAELVYDTDPNLTNLLISKDWHIWMIDFTRAFRTSKDIREPKNLEKCDRQLLDKLKQLNADDVREKTKGHLEKSQVEALMTRRDKIVAYFAKLVQEKGEANVLY